MEKLTKKEKQQIIQRLLTIGVILIVLGAATFAWFAQNDKAESEGVSVFATTEAMLAIGVDPTSITGSIVSFPEDTPSELGPCTHHDNQFELEEVYETGLAYNSNPSVIATGTGVQKDKKQTIRLATISEDDQGFYKDYKIYMACVGLSMSTKDVIASIKASSDDSTSDYIKATTVDFYRGNPTKNGYLGTLNLAGIDYANSWKRVDKLYLPITDIPSIDKISKGEAQPILLTMRFYFDGGLMKDINHTYIRAEGLTIKPFSVSINFSAERNVE